MRAGVVISVVSHCVLVALALLGTPKLFDSEPLAAIEVDLVRPEEVEQPKEKPLEKKPPEEKPAPFIPLPDPSAPPRAAEPAPAAAPKAAPTPQVAAPTPQPKPPAQNQQALGPQIPSPAAAPPPQQSTTPWIFDPVNIPALLDLPNAPDKGFDAEATTMANLSNEERAAFKDHLKKCWKLPEGMSAAQTKRVVLRIYLRRDGSLASEPVLIEASAPPDGPVLLKAAIRTLKDCQPYGFLPADKYREWKVLDLSFSPRDMSGPT
jgi:hypothetical protein